MPVETLEVGGKRYLYFYYYDPAKKRKKRVYCGPKGSPEAIQKAEQFQSRYEKAQDQKDRFTGVIGQLSALSGEIAGYSLEDREFVLTCLMQAYPDLSWVESDQMALFGKVYGNKELERRLAPIYDDLKAGLTRVHDVTGELRMLIEYIDSDWYYRVRYRERGEGDEKPERDPSWKYHVNEDPENMVVEILRGWLDAYDHAKRRLDALQEFSRDRNLHANIEALALIGVTKAVEDSAGMVQKAVDLILRG